MDTPQPVREDAEWPMKTILLMGYFGNKTPEGRRYRNRCVGATAFLALALFALMIVLPHAPRSAASERLIGALLYSIVSGAFSFIAWAFWKYLAELDELARGLQLQAMCLAYLTGLGAMGWLGALGVWAQWNIPPLVAFILLEPVRGFWLWKLARRYQ